MGHFQKHSEETKRKMSVSHLGKCLSKKTREKMSKSNMGHFVSEETKMKISKANKGKTSPNKGKHFSVETKRKMSEARKRRKEKLGYINSSETRKKMSEAHRGKRLTEKHKRKIGESNKERKLSEEVRRRRSEAQRGENNPFWKGGISPLNKIIRRGIEFRLWREAVFARDNWTCQRCSRRGGELHPHHIKNFAQYPDLRFAIDNGITFCKDCHIKFHKIYGRENNNEAQVREFCLGAKL